MENLKRSVNVFWHWTASRKNQCLLESLHKRLKGSCFRANKLFSTSFLYVNWCDFVTVDIGLDKASQNSCKVALNPTNLGGPLIELTHFVGNHLPAKFIPFILDKRFCNHRIPSTVCNAFGFSSLQICLFIFTFNQNLTSSLNTIFQSSLNFASVHLPKLSCCGRSYASIYASTLSYHKMFHASSNRAPIGGNGAESIFH